MQEEAVKERREVSHRPLRIWLAIIIGSLVFSGAVMFWNPGVTGFVSFDTGPNPNFNPDFVDQNEYTSHLSTTLFFVAMLVALQIGIYMMVTRFYSHLEEGE